MRPLHDEIFSDKVAVNFVKPEQILLIVAVHANFADVAPLRKNMPADSENEHALIAGFAFQRAVIQVAQLCGDSLSFFAQKNPGVADSRQIRTPKFFAVTPLLVVGSFGNELEENFQIFCAQPSTKNFAGIRVDIVPTKTLAAETRIAQSPIENVQTNFACVVVFELFDGLNQHACRDGKNIFIRGRIVVEPLQNFNPCGQFGVRAEEIFQRDVNELRRFEEIRQAQSFKRASTLNFRAKSFDMFAKRSLPKRYSRAAKIFRNVNELPDMSDGIKFICRRINSVFAEPS